MDTIQATATLCPNCGNQSKTTDYCSNCSRPIGSRQAPSSVASRPVAMLPGEDLANLLVVLAFGILICGLFFAMYVWAEYGTISSGGLFGQSYSVSNPYAKIAAFVIAANSVIWSALLGGVSRAILNTIELSRLIGQRGAK
jgi:hypothetical protein